MADPNASCIFRSNGDLFFISPLVSEWKFYSGHGSEG
jgi:hypothetical protein